MDLKKSLEKMYTNTETIYSILNVFRQIFTLNYIMLLEIHFY